MFYNVSLQTSRPLRIKLLEKSRPRKSVSAFDRCGLRERSKQGDWDEETRSTCFACKDFWDYVARVFKMAVEE